MGLAWHRSPSAEGAPHNRRLSGANRACSLPLASTPGCVLSPGLKLSPPNSPCYNSLIQMSHLQLPVLHVPVLLTPLASRHKSLHNYLLCLGAEHAHCLPLDNCQKLLPLPTSLPR